MEAENLHFFVEGRVQGVGFRRFILRKAEALSITGWVQNTFDHRVEVFASGNSASLSSFLQACRDTGEGRADPGDYLHRRRWNHDCRGSHCHLQEA